MAKTYLKVFRDAAEEQFLTGNYPIMAMAAGALKSGKIKFLPLLGEANDGVNTIPEYVIQRWHRIKEKDLDNSISQAAAGTAFVDLMDSAIDVTWESITTQRTTRKQLLVKIKKGEGTNALADAGPFQRAIATKTTVKLISKEERAVDKIIASGTEIPVDAGFVPGLDGAEYLRNLFADTIDRIEEQVDNFKYQAKAAAFYFKRIGRLMSRLEGQNYQQGTNTFPDAKGTSFTLEGTEYFNQTVLKSLQIGTAGDDTDKVVLAIIMADDSYADAGLETGMMPVNQSLVLNDVVGHVYEDLSIVIDAPRIYYITATIAQLKSAGLVGSTYRPTPKVND